MAGGQPAEPQLQQARPGEEVVSLASHPQFQLEAPQFEPQLGIDPFQVDYSSQQLGMQSSMDSPNFNIDYNQVR